jgi:uncharacterized protein YndB with AHSA1/START domain
MVSRGSVGAVGLLVLAVWAPASTADEPVIRIGGAIVIDASREQVWSALTTPEGLARWIAPESSVELELGGSYELYFFPDNPDDRGMEGTKVLAFVPHEMLATTGEIPGTWSVWRLDDAAAGGTRVRFDGLGTGAQWRQRSGHFAEATPGVLDRLKRAVEPGEPAGGRSGGREKRPERGIGFEGDECS